jgi:hypothetical protein
MKLLVSFQGLLNISSDPYIHSCGKEASVPVRFIAPMLRARVTQYIFRIYCICVEIQAGGTKTPVNLSGFTDIFSDLQKMAGCTRKRYTW